MSITTDRIAQANGIGERTGPLDAVAKPYLLEALSGVLDCLISGVLIVGNQGRILHANSSAQEMLEAKSPIISLGGYLCALHAERTKELRLAIAAAQTDRNAMRSAGIGVPLTEKTGVPAAAQVLPLACKSARASQSAQTPVAVLVMSANAVAPFETGTLVQNFHLTPEEARLLQQLVSGASLHEAASALGIAEATARTHRNHIFTKTGVSRRCDLLLLVGRLVPPIRHRH